MDKIAFFSPLNPIRSGISDYSEDLLPYLKDYFDIDVYVSNGFEIENAHIRTNFTIRTYNEFARLFNQKEYKAIIYHMGNNYYAHKEIYDFMMQYPGIVVLHDFSLHHFYAAKTLENGDMKSYENEMFYSHGKEGLREVEKFVKGEIPPIWETNSLNFPLNLRVLDRAAGVIVHSQFAQSHLQEIASYVPICVAPIPAPFIEDPDNMENAKFNAREKLNIDQGCLILSTLGFVNHTKRVDKILEALYELKRERVLKDFKFYIVGQLAADYPLEEKIKKLSLTEDVIVTGFVDLQDFDRYISASDICFNLRYPTQGENSASLLRIMGHGKPVITTDIGSFSEFPEEIVFKVSYGEKEKEEIKLQLSHLLHYKFKELGESIIQYTLNRHSIYHCIQKYKEFSNSIISGNQCNTFLTLDKLIQSFALSSSTLFNESNNNSINRFVNSLNDIFKDNTPQN
ncbi:glycosyltransferase family 4 protein [Paenibacillus sp. TAB 01]|uniref:glycosyltransferase family 4 protein n=1 Tax=Paenibacillus sp. TAB 01 TaxID=3368988 RepID=UPI0037537CF3